VCHSPLHALEFANALHLKIFRGQATPVQAQAALALVETDLKAGVLLSPPFGWSSVFEEALQLLQQRTGQTGCRFLDILHCALAKPQSASQFVTADSRQEKLALAMGLNLVAV
jgi:hypothetical protein